MYRRIFFLLIAWLLVIPAAPMSAQAPDGYPVPHPPEVGLRGERPFGLDVPQAQAQPRMVDAADAVVQAGTTYTWTVDTRAEWEQGWFAREYLDSATLSGTLRLMQRWFGESVSVTPEDQLAADQQSPVIAAGPDGTLYAVWVDTRNGDGDIYFARSTDGGATWSTNMRVNDAPGTVDEWTSPSLAVDGDGTLYAVWTDTRNGDGDIYFARSTDGGATWSANVRVDDDTGTAGQYAPALAVAGNGTLYAVWTDDRNGNYDSAIYFARSTDGGATWSTNVRVDDDLGAADQEEPSLAVGADGTLYAVWTDGRNYSYDIYFAKSTDGGATWSADVRVNDDTGMARQVNPSLGVGADGTLYAVWSDNRNGNYNFDIYFARSTDGGATWSTNVRVNDDAGTAGQGSPALAVEADGTLYAVWTDGRNGDWDIYFAKSTDGGATWSANVRVSDDTGTAYQTAPSLAVDGNGTLFAVWQDTHNGNYDNYDIYFARSTDGGATWSADTRVNDDSGSITGQYDPVLVAGSDGTLYAVWVDRRNGNTDIYFAKSTDGGQAWSANVRVNDQSGTVYYYGLPALAVGADGTLYAVWGDRRNGNADIYFAKSADGGQHWSAGVRVNDDTGTAWQYAPALAVAGNGTLYAVWTDDRNGNNADLYFAKSTDGGATWSANVRVNDDTGTASQWDPSLAVGAGGTLYAVWVDERNDLGDIYFARSTDGGATWSANVRVNDDTDTARQLSSNLAVGADGTLYAVWEDGHDNDIYFARSTDGGATWGASVRVDDDPGTAWQDDPALAVDGDGTLYTVWGEKRNGDYDYDIYFARSTDGGATWSANVRVDDDSGTADQYSPSLAVDGNGTLYAAWVNERYGFGSNYNYIRVARSLPAPAYRPEGTYTSPILDTGVNGAAWETLTYSATLPPGTSLAFESRSRVAGGPWSAWEPVQGVIASPPGQYFQYRVTLSTSLTDATPVLDWVKVVYHTAGTPSAPRFATPCGVTNHLTPTLKGAAAAGSTVHLYVDGMEVLSTTADANGTFILAPGLSTGSHVLTATAENGEGVGPASASLSLVVSPTLAYDPINVRAGQWSRDGWLLSVPRDGNGCADPTNAWRVWPRANQKFRVEVPVSYTTSAAVTVTVGTQTITLTEVTHGAFVGVFEPPIEGGAFVIEVSADGRTTTVTGGPVLIDPDGVVYEASGTISDTIPGVQVTLYYSDTHSGQWLMWDAWNYDQANPLTTSEDGYYSFYTPPGTYRVVAEKEGYATYTSEALVVVDEPVRQNVPLVTWRIYLPLVLRGR